MIAGWEPVTPDNPYQYMSLNLPPQFLPYYNVKGDMLWNKVAPIVRTEEEDGDGNGNNCGQKFLSDIALLVSISTEFLWYIVHR